MKKNNTVLECDLLSQNGAEPQSTSPTATTTDAQTVEPDGYQVPGAPNPSGDGPGGDVNSAQGLVKKNLCLEPAVLLRIALDGYVPPRPPGPSGIPQYFAIEVRELRNHGFRHNLPGLTVFLSHASADARLRRIIFQVLSPDREILFQIVEKFNSASAKLYVLSLDKVATQTLERYFDPSNTIRITVETSVAMEAPSLGIASTRENR